MGIAFYVGIFVATNNILWDYGYYNQDYDSGLSKIFGHSSPIHGGFHGNMIFSSVGSWVPKYHAFRQTIGTFFFWEVVADDFG